MGFLTGIEIRRRISIGDLKIHSLDPDEPFSVDNQVTEDAVDLRLAPAGLVLRQDVESIDYVNDDLDKLYDIIEIPATGYVLPPHEVLLTQSLEAICLPADILGLVVTRSSFARLGLLVNCLAPKSPPGIKWAFPLQLVNISRVPLTIYPFTSVAQLILSEMSGEPIGYRGKFQDSYTVTPPLFSAREKQSIGARNPHETLRTFHIIARDALNQQGTSRPANTEGVHLPAEDSASRRRRSVDLAILTLSTLAAIGFGIAGNIISGGKIDYWQGVSLVLLLLLSAACTAAALLLQASQSRRRR
ncbi:hypothetical protein [Micromonospora sp. NPDC049301]|uniref:dCTP deaminase n=1 Tax=Micromonospora sp. NPDC049301 TaxID=3155723 RepID=UPI0034410CF5